MNNEEAKKASLLPTNDWVFKRIYGREGSERITEKFIKAFLDLDVKLDKIENEKTLNVDITSDKAGRLDVLATTVTGMKINLEMQMWNYSNIEAKLSGYGCELFAEGITQGLDYSKANKVIVVMIVAGNVKRYEPYEKFMLKYNIREEDYHDLLLTNNLEFYIIFLDKIKKQIAEGKIQDKEKIAIWTKFLLTPQELKEEEMSENEEVKEAKELYDDFLGDTNERWAAFGRHIHMMDMNSAKGEGIKEGREEGAKDKALEIAKKMLKSKEPIEKIIEFTELTKEEIEALKEN